MILVRVISPTPVRMVTYCGLVCASLAILCSILLFQRGFRGEIIGGLAVAIAVFFGIFPRLIQDHYLDQNDRNIILRKSSLSYHDQKGKMVEIPRQTVVRYRLKRRIHAFSQELIIQTDCGTHTLNLLLYRSKEADLILKFFQYPEDQWATFFTEWLEKEQKR